VMSVFAFSQLLEHYRSEYQIKIAVNLLNDLLGDRDGALYVCEDSTIFVVVRNLPKPQQDKMVFQLRYLFMDDPLAYTPEGDENPDFCQHYVLDQDWQEAMDILKRRLVMRVRKNQSGLPRSLRQNLPELPEQKIVKAREARMLNASSLASIEKELLGVDLTPILRRQPICAAIPDTAIRSVFDEMYINIAHLRKTLSIDVDLLSNRWLFKYLTQILDDKMLELIAKDTSRYLSTPISLNLNIPTLLSHRFTEFDAKLKPGMKVSVVIELQIADVFADMSAFLYAKDTVQKLGYRVCLDGVTEQSFPQIDRQRLGFDLIKLQWNADSEADAKSDYNRKLQEAIRACGSNRVILTRCDNQKAVDYGHALGLSLFQGRYLDQMMNPKATVQN
jgi:EAL domain-containing protein (putative c-di-GMP-specific phosphodiesterase class I)